MLEKIKRFTIPSNDDVPNSICRLFKLVATTPTDISFTYNSCKDGTTTTTVSGESSIKVCAYNVGLPTNDPTQWDIFIEDPC